MPRGVYLRTEEHLKRLREHALNNSRKLTGKKQSPESIKKRASQLRGKPSWNY